MIEKNKLKIGRFLLMGILFLLTASLISATYTRSDYTYSSGSSFDVGGFFGNANLFDNSMCVEGQDFVLQIAPFGCSPALVTSDLLEEQNVPVFCQVAATKINPLVEVKAIDSMSFTGDYDTNLIAGVGFHPAKAALGNPSTSLNSPILNNVGYVVVVLKKQVNESSMPETVSGNLTARIKYNIKNAFGIGNVDFYLPAMSDSDWELNKPQYSFWNGRGYLRADAVYDNGAVISLYSDTGVLSRVSLEKGKSSGKIYLPGLECQAGLEIRLDDLKNPGTRAKFNINGQYVEAVQGQTFLDGRCTVTGIPENQGLNQQVTISCKEDVLTGGVGSLLGGGSKSYTLKIAPKVEVILNGNPKRVGVGEELYSAGIQHIYVGYIGKNKKNEMFLLPVLSKVGTPQEFLKSSEYSVAQKIGDSFQGASELSLSNLVGSVSIIANAISRFGLDTITETGVADPVIQGAGAKNLEFKQFKNLKDKISGGEIGNQVYNVNFPKTEAPNKELTSENKQNYDAAMRDYNSLVDGYANEQEQGAIATYGERALIEEIELSKKTSQLETLQQKCNEFKRKYPSSKRINEVGKTCDDIISLLNTETSGLDILINGEYRRISFEGVEESKYEDYGAEVAVSGALNSVLNGVLELKKNDIHKFSESKDDWFKLTNVEDNYIDIFYNIQTNIDTTKKTYSSGTVRIKLDTNENLVTLPGTNYQIKLREIKLTKMAKVSVVPTIDNEWSEANMTFQIAIEKRAIKLTPEKVKKKILELNKTIEDLNKTNENLGKVVKTMNAACLTTGTLLSMKNLVSNLDGKAIARQNVMSYWNEECTRLIQEGGGTYDGARTVEGCLIKKSSDIEKSVSDRLIIMKEQDANSKLIEAQKDVTTSSFGGLQTDLNSVKYREIYVGDKEYLASLDSIKSFYKDQGGIPVGGGKTVSAEEFDKMAKDKTLPLATLREIELNGRLLNSGNSDLIKMADQTLRADLQKINVAQQYADQVNSLNQAFTSNGFSKMSVVPLETKDTINYPYSGQTAKPTQIVNNEGIKVDLKLDDTKEYPIQAVPYLNKQYLFVLKNYGANSKYGNALSDAYEITKLDKEKIYIDMGKTLKEVNREVFEKISFTGYDSTTYNNPYVSSLGEAKICMRYYETEPYKGMPAIVPFDKKNGWYASVKQTLPIGTTTASYAASGRVASFSVCNVGKNGIEENGGGDDICQLIETGTGQAYNYFAGLNPAQASAIIQKANKAVQEAQNNHREGMNSVNIAGDRFEVCGPAADVPSMQCTNFMSPKDCQLLFNVCDPVVCPSSRCNLGGAYPVKNVIQQGIIGSILLCLPNWNEGIYIPICLSGIKAGLDSLISLLTSYRDCLQENLDTGKMTGICDEVYSLYLCDLVWKEVLPLVKIGLPKIISAVLGQTYGGGEYLGVQSAFDTAQDSMKYVSQYYASETNRVFQARSVEEFIGAEVCKNKVSGVYPSMDIMDSLIEPESPPQFTGWFTSTTFTDATNPPISQYKVYYHIYAGANRGAAYQVYLKPGPGGSFYQDVTTTKMVDSGYLATGETVDETKDFTATSGYQQLCINVNGQVDCGFGQVSTSFALNYVREKVVADQAKDSDITTQGGCISGETNLGTVLLNPNLQAGAESLVNPEIYKQGLSRVCATLSPGKGVDEKDGLEGSRWVEVGYCDEPNIKCWLDTTTVDNVIKNKNIKGDTISSLTANVKEGFEEANGYLSETDYTNAVDKIKKLSKEADSLKGEGRAGKILEMVDEINLVIDKAFWNYQKARLIWMRAGAYNFLVKDVRSAEEKESALMTSECTQTGETCGASGICNCPTLGVCECIGEEGPIAEITSCLQKCVNNNYNIGEILIENECTNIGGLRSFDSTDNCCCYNKVEETTTTATTATTGESISDRKNLNYDFKKIWSETDVKKAINGADKKLISSKCNDYAKIITEKGNVNEVDQLLLVAMIMQESTCIHTAVGDGGNSIGLMQISMKNFCGKYGLDANLGTCKTQLLNPSTNINVGAQILKKNYNDLTEGKQYDCPQGMSIKYSGWEKALRGYNGWNTDCSRGANDYVARVMDRYVALRKALDNSYKVVGEITTTAGTASVTAPATKTYAMGIPKLTQDETTGEVTLQINHGCDKVDYTIFHDWYADTALISESKGGYVPLVFGKNEQRFNFNFFEVGEKYYAGSIDCYQKNADGSFTFKRRNALQTDKLTIKPKIILTPVAGGISPSITKEVTFVALNQDPDGVNLYIEGNCLGKYTIKNSFGSTKFEENFVKGNSVISLGKSMFSILGKYTAEAYCYPDPLTSSVIAKISPIAWDKTTDKISFIDLSQEGNVVVLKVKHSCEKDAKFIIYPSGLYSSAKTPEIKIVENRRMPISDFNGLNGKPVFEKGDEYIAKVYCEEQPNLFEESYPLIIK